MEVQIISKEILKPSSSTPQHRRTYKLSVLDQLAPPLYIPIILFYSPPCENFCKNSNHLKESFSRTLTHFYPFAGRVKDDFSIDCNDEGAAFIEARVSGDMSMVIEQADINQHQHLLPCSPYAKISKLSTDQVTLAVQVNYFNCGGMAISICIWHAVADGSALATFVKSWAAITRDPNNVLEEVIYDCTTLFPPQDLSSFSLHNFVKEEVLSEIVTKRFLFDGSMVAALRDEVGNGPSLDRPTRFIAVSSLILAAMITVTRENEVGQQISAATIAVDLRRRLKPPVPEQSIGNIFQVAIANWPEIESNALNYSSLAGKLDESIRKMNDEYIRKFHGGGGYFNFIKRAGEEAMKGSNMVVFSFSSWCKFPFYEADFGWGKPIWLSPALKLNRVAIFVDTADGEGIEAWISLSKEDMVMFEQHPGIFTYASFSPSI
ncbi:vinorine synthase [Salix suchowensis]|nr:vinorine synthase [Salix suchowensis]